MQRIHRSDVLGIKTTRLPSELKIEELAEDIKKNGQKEPILIRRWAKGYKSGLLINGYRRFMALKMLGRKTIKVVYEKGTTVY